MDVTALLSAKEREKIRTTANLFLAWVFKAKTDKKLTPKTKYDMPDELAYCQAFCREKWNKYGFKIVKKALNHTACISPAAFIDICDFFKKNNKAS